MAAPLRVNAIGTPGRVGVTIGVLVTSAVFVAAMLWAKWVPWRS